MFRSTLQFEYGKFWSGLGGSGYTSTHHATGGSKQNKSPANSADNKLNEIITHTLGNSSISEAERFRNLLETLNTWITLDTTKHSLNEKEAVLNADNLRTKITSNPRFALQMESSLLETNLTNLQQNIAQSLTATKEKHEATQNLPINDFLMQKGISGAETNSLNLILKNIRPQETSSFSKAEQHILISKAVDTALSEASGENREDGAYSKAFNKALAASLREHAGKFDKAFLQETIKALDANAGLIGTVSMIRKGSHGEALAEAIAGGTNNSSQNKTEAFAKLEEREKAWSQAKDELTKTLSEKDKPAAIEKVVAEGDKFLEGLHGMVAAGTIDLNTEAGLTQLQDLVNGLKDKHTKAYVELATTKAVESNEVKNTSNSILEKYGLNLDQIIGKGVAAITLLAVFKSILGGGGAKMLMRDGLNPGGGLLRKGIGLVLLSGILQHTGVLGEKGSGVNKLLEKLAA